MGQDQSSGVLPHRGDEIPAFDRSVASDAKVVDFISEFLAPTPSAKRHTLLVAERLLAKGVLKTELRLTLISYNKFAIDSAKRVHEDAGAQPEAPGAAPGPDFYENKEAYQKEFHRLVGLPSSTKLDHGSVIFMLSARLLRVTSPAPTLPMNPVGFAKLALDATAIGFSWMSCSTRETAEAAAVAAAWYFIPSVTDQSVPKGFAVAVLHRNETMPALELRFIDHLVPSISDSTRTAWLGLSNDPKQVEMDTAPLREALVKFSATLWQTLLLDKELLVVDGMKHTPVRYAVYYSPPSGLQEEPVSSLVLWDGVGSESAIRMNSEKGLFGIKVPLMWAGAGKVPSLRSLAMRRLQALSDEPEGLPCVYTAFKMIPPHLKDPEAPERIETEQRARRTRPYREVF